jgi:hypothetical protein
MSPESAISSSENSYFNAVDMRRATGLSERSQRELLKLGILQAVPQSRTATRLFNSRMLKRAAVIYPLHEHGGFSLQTSGKIIYADILLERTLEFIDPWRIRQRLSRSRAPGLEREWNLLTAKTPPVTQPDDYYIALINRHYVASGDANQLRVYGHLTEDRTDIVVYRGFVWDELITPSGKISDQSPSEFHPEAALTGASRLFRSTDISTEEVETVRRAHRSPVSKFSVNVSLTLRMAIRRLLKIEDATCAN